MGMGELQGPSQRTRQRLLEGVHPACLPEHHAILESVELQQLAYMHMHDPYMKSLILRKCKLSNF